MSVINNFASERLILRKNKRTISSLKSNKSDTRVFKVILFFCNNCHTKIQVSNLMHFQDEIGHFVFLKIKRSEMKVLNFN